MGKKGSWFSAIKRAFTPTTTKEKPFNEAQGFEKKSGKKKWGLGKLRHGGGGGGDTSSTFSSIEKILGDVDAQWEREIKEQRHNQSRPPNLGSSSDRAPSMPLTSPTTSSKSLVVYQHHNQTPIQKINAAIKIQAAYRAYMARRSFRALKGLVRLQGVVRGQSVRRQTANAMKQMQLLVKVQSQIHSRRIRMLESQARHIPHNKNDLENSLGGRFKWGLSQTSDRQNEEWDDSLLTKEEIELRNQRKAEAAVKRERALAYADSLQWLKARSAQTALVNMRSGGFPWWRTWIERQLPGHFSDNNLTPSPIPGRFSENNNRTPSPLPRRLSENNSRTPSPFPRRFSENYNHTPSPIPRRFTDNNLTPSPVAILQEPSPRTTPKSSKPRVGVENFESPRPRSSKSTTMARTKQTPIQPNSRAPQQEQINDSSTSTPVKKHMKPRGGDFSFDVQMRDDDSLRSCPPFSVPNYMTPTVSAKAKLRGLNSPKEERLSTPDAKKQRRMSFPLTPNIGSSIKWNKAYSLFSRKDTSSQFGKNKSSQSISNLSVDSTTSMPAAVGRKPFNRFV